jgi:hypothetical protein
LIQQFESRELPADQWCHRLHIRVTFIYLREYQFAEALCRLRAKIRAYNVAQRIPESLTSGYHETLTVAWLRLIADRMRHNDVPDNSDALCNAHSDLLDKTILRAFYSPDRITSLDAKRSFVGPDLQPLPQAGVS